MAHCRVATKMRLQEVERPGVGTKQLCNKLAVHTPGASKAPTLIRSTVAELLAHGICLTAKGDLDQSCRGLNGFIVEESRSDGAELDVLVALAKFVSDSLAIKSSFHWAGQIEATTILIVQIIQ